MDRKTRSTLHIAAKATGPGIFLPVLLVFLALSTNMGLAQANGAEPVASIIDQPITETSKVDVKEIKKLVGKEQDKLAKKDRKELEKLAPKGERLTLVAIGADYATEAQQVLYAPAAANAAISDALAWYSLAAQRGYPGTRSLTTSGVKFLPVRVVRNK